MKAMKNRMSHVLHRYLNDFKRTLIALAVGIWIAFGLCVALALGLRG